MATRLTTEEVHLELEGSDGEVSSEDEDDYEGEGIVGYLPEPASYFPEALRTVERMIVTMRMIPLWTGKMQGWREAMKIALVCFKQFSSITILRRSVTVIIEI